MMVKIFDCIIVAQQRIEKIPIGVQGDIKHTDGTVFTVDYAGE